jgi:hypothetical protein
VVETILGLRSAARRVVGESSRCPAALDQVSLWRRIDAQVAMLTSWINDTCRPDEMGHIAGFSYQEAPGKPLNLQVYCRQGESGKLGKVKVVRTAYPSEFPLEIPLSLTVSTERAVILGFNVTKITGLMDPPSGTVVMVVKE